MKTLEDMMYPENDAQYTDVIIESVIEENKGWSIKRDDGWSFFVQSDSPIHPTIGMSARFYGKGIGHRVRGLYLDGIKIFYRTEDEDKEYSEIEMYGENSVDWLKRWDAGQSVWSIEMGGLGPGYEQCIQIAMTEILRFMIDKKYDTSQSSDKEEWQKNEDEINKMGHENPIINQLGLSGAQWGAALNLATHFYKKGPRSIMADAIVKDRHIQISKKFPHI